MSLPSLRKTTLIGLTLVLVACGSETANQSSAVPSPDGMEHDTVCFMQLSDQQRAELTDIVESGVKVDDEVTVCVLEKGADGTYIQHYYTDDDLVVEDDFTDHTLYALLLGRSYALLPYMLLDDDDLGAGDIMLLTLLYNVNKHGRAYKPFGQHGDDWKRKKSSTKLTMRQVQYDRTAPVVWTAAKRPTGVKLPEMPRPEGTVYPGGVVLSTTTKSKKTTASVPTTKQTPTTTTSSKPSSKTTPETSASVPKAPVVTTTTAAKCKGSKPYGTPPNCRAKR